MMTGTKAFHLNNSQCNTKVGLPYLFGIPQFQLALIAEEEINDISADIVNNPDSWWKKLR